ncbi:HesA/MoeB/ThiF family protein [Gilvimarinus algae]|uniref:Molybdopterin-synthase adenylyltransferase MoeB n=1 Tax=Gilvimarinus algae TaxID=3058037 RepID=A0ABT8TFT9_9GAMM|nr:molybdopterin-synthase adenylyltransferase MoeB [Gilvimarinus sp. SDUM040014]MDO3381973.1 molybdopterin-synthase adenylyltransferase MoeB [Gilvimarinus sp. SDUM040014]
MADLSDEQLLRYSRQIMLGGVDIEGQQALLSSKVLVLGLGGLGAPVAMYLAAAGVGELILADDDVVELSNLQRQIIHRTDAIGKGKAESAREALAQLNPDVRVTLLAKRLDTKALTRALDGVQVAVDCSDNFTTRFALNAACVAAGIPLVSGAAIALEGQVAVFDPRQAASPCYRCLYQEQRDEQLSCATSGVLAPLVGIIGSVQALETIKLLTGLGETLAGRVQFYDAFRGQWREMRLPKDPECPVCAQRDQ